MTQHSERHLREYLHHLLLKDPQAGLRAWAEAFDAARQAWEVEQCRWLLAEIRRGVYAHHPRIRGLALDRHGQWLMQLGAWEEAIFRFEQSLAIFREMDDILGEAQSLNGLGNVYQALRDVQQAESCYREALSLQRAGGDQRQEAITLNNLAVVLGDQGQLQVAFETLQQSLRLLREVGSPNEIGRALLNLGKFATYLGEVEHGGAYYREALTVLEKAGDRLGLVYAYNGLGNYYKRRGKLQEAANYYTQSLQLAQEIGDLKDQEQALGNLGTLYHERGAWAEAEHYYRQAAEICEAVGDEAGLADWLGNLALVLGLQDREAEARSLLERQLILHRKYGNRSGEGVALLNLATYYRDVGELTTADHYFQEAASVAREVHYPDLEARVQTAWGSVPWRQGRFADAQAMFEQALEIYKSQDDPRGQFSALYKLAGLNYERKDWAMARTFAEAAWNVGQALDIPYWHGHVLWLLGAIALEQGDKQGVVYLAEAALRAASIGDEERVQMSLQSLLEKVTAYNETGDRSRALELSREALAFWNREPEKVPEALAMLMQVVEALESG